MLQLPFIKMHGAGNDFVIIDARLDRLQLTPEQITYLSDRHRGIGCDQLIVVKRSAIDGCNLRMVIYNSDGSLSGACGNATRCVADLFMEEQGTSSVIIEVDGRILHARRDNGLVNVNMGIPGLNWQDIPLAEERDTLHVEGISRDILQDPAAVSMGNPHIVFFVNDIAYLDLPQLAGPLEHHALLPERANIGVAQIISQNHIKLRVFERGAGETLACGSGACAALVAASRRGLTGREAQVELPGGTLHIHWDKQDHVWMSGPVAMSFTGVVSV